MTLFQALYGRTPPSFFMYTAGQTPTASLDEHLLTRQQLLALLKQYLSRAQHRLKHMADKKRHDKEFLSGD